MRWQSDRRCVRCQANPQSDDGHVCKRLQFKHRRQAQKATQTLCVLFCEIAIFKSKASAATSSKRMFGALDRPRRGKRENGQVGEAMTWSLRFEYFTQANKSYVRKQSGERRSSYRIHVCLRPNGPQQRENATRINCRQREKNTSFCGDETKPDGGIAATKTFRKRTRAKPATGVPTTRPRFSPHTRAA